MLMRHHNLRGGNWLAIFILNGDLAFGIWPQALVTRMAGLRQKLQDALRIIKRCGHKVWGFIAGIAEHDTLITGTHIFGTSLIHALGDIG